MPGNDLDPIQLQKRYEKEFAAARLKAEADARTAVSLAPPSPYVDIAPARQRPAATYSAPDYSREARKAGGDTEYGGERLPQATNVKAEYQTSGSWKAQPTG
jgi:hypothetical protein